ncbi:general transcription factor 3C polypeptide 6 [Rana temporaria]|uniref:general transcription factor 3C polypeptide 6 n=1 Tax=Rana temporaria TaxID=8407 RepID=UPI001AACAE18|nr:general transcription factor 3C polypeptide 6 [Rana temporaria]XP_040199142.1 general transcription factor 3C polypeptide 6 [Rana temporaria]XP_040199144.1 general transcription factor 3C polypeptide 6 [Rana temporaria]
MSSKSLVNTDVQQGSLEAGCVPRHDSDEEYEEEEHLVSVELTGIIDSDILEKCSNKCKILGINTEKPFLQVDKYVFAGEYEDALGTCVIFEEILDHGDAESKPKLKYKCHTVKKLNMTRTFLTEKKEGDDGGGKIEWFQIKEESNTSWPQMICSFAQENEEADDSASEEEDHEQLNKSTEDVEQAEQSLGPSDKPHSNSEEKGNANVEGKEQLDPEREVLKEEQNMDTDKVDGGTGKPSCTTEQTKTCV